MRLFEKVNLLKVFVKESEQAHGMSLYEWIITEARRSGLAGATATRGLMGYGRHRTIHTFKIERLAEDLPVIIEIVDQRQKLEAFLESLPELAGKSFTLIEEVEIPGQGGKGSL